MGMFSVLNISGSGLTAQRLRLDVIANNIANATSTRTTEGGPFQRSRVVLRPINDRLTFKSHLLPDALEPGVGEGVRVLKIEKDEKPPRMVYDPTHPDAIKSGKWKGYVMYPNVNIVEEMVDMISANRSYEANVTMINSARQMFEKALSLGK
ncbi:flagellar basal body rod protein FlgC [Thermospira aquatica]|uniref:Flagellar basal-body rod protein FlgC n=1 Tax=Thermospira aquatica TaxID=2828656 RepID=A0AAX3BBB8_9SPIR|nr:flagellar basal body rod protein FlgC [Thermospira aquatica]URA09613.1 flagellar basal body rod protein FlgC [Thermospira aquatica]